MNVPSVYEEGYREARLVDAEIADKYIAHTMIGDPVMDAIVEELSTLPREKAQAFIRAGMDEDREGLQGAPPLLRDFFVDDPPPVPDWVDYEAFGPGIRAFQRNSAMVLAAFVTGVLIDGFHTMISKSFVQTGRIFDNGVWRLKQNNRQMLEIFWPGGLMRQGDGWKLSVRIRLVHAQVRRLLSQTDEWGGEDVYGVPISAAHVGYSIACFSARTVKHSESLGARYTAEERASFHDVWRYAGHLMGIPDSILYTNEEDALRLYRIGGMCEPVPETDAIVMTNALINSAPLVAGIEDKDERDKLVSRVIYPVSRGLIGNEMADALRFPKRGLPFPLFFFRLDQKIQRLRARFLSGGSGNFAALLDASAYNDEGISYRLPDHAHAERSSEY